MTIPQVDNLLSNGRRRDAEPARTFGSVEEATAYITEYRSRVNEDL
jgi:hypothetical protein